jgi:hypothetical protein
MSIEEDYQMHRILITAVALVFSASAVANTLTVTEDEYGDEWPYVVSEGELECHINAVIMHTSRGTYSINGKAIGRYKGKYPEGRVISKQDPIIDDPRFRMPPPHGLIQRGLDLCK